MVDFVSRLNSLRVNRESTAGMLASDSPIYPLSCGEHVRLLVEEQAIKYGASRRETKGHVRLSDTRVSNQDDLSEQAGTNQCPILAFLGCGARTLNK